jgi:hypothetical protein
MSNFEEIELLVCTVCIHLLSNGEYNDGTDAAEVAAAGQLIIWGENAIHLVPGGDDQGYCTGACDSCGNTDHGDRFTAAALIPKA